MDKPRTLKLNVLSDLHLGQAGMPLPHTDADIIILAGDICRPREAMAWASRIDKPVLYVPGNHEFYGSNVPQTIAELKRLAAGTQIHVLDNESFTFRGVRFLGSTLWTDFNLDGAGAARGQAITEALEFIRDFVRIESETSPGGKLTPEEMEALFVRNRGWLKARLAERYDGPTVVITHHAPSTRSIHPRFAMSPVNTCFVSNSEDLMDGDGPMLWIHGHTHDSFDYRIKSTRVVCNPRGYMRDGVIENTAFDPHFVVRLPLA